MKIWSVWFDVLMVGVFGALGAAMIWKPYINILNWITLGFCVFGAGVTLDTIRMKLNIRFRGRKG